MYIRLTKNDAAPALWLFEGEANTGELDLTRERLDTTTLDYGPLNGRGVLNWCHQDGPQYIIGDVFDAELRPGKGVRPTLYIRGTLHEWHPIAQALHRKLTHGAAHFGLSVEGSRGRDVKMADGSTDIQHASVWAVAVTPNPADPLTDVRLLKSMTLDVGGNAYALQTEQLVSQAQHRALPKLRDVTTEWYQGPMFGSCSSGRDHYSDGTIGRGKPGIKKHLQICHGLPETAATTYLDLLEKMLAGQPA